MNVLTKAIRFLFKPSKKLTDVELSRILYQNHIEKFIEKLLDKEEYRKRSELDYSSGFSIDVIALKHGIVRKEGISDDILRKACFKILNKTFNYDIEGIIKVR